MTTVAVLPKSNQDWEMPFLPVNYKNSLTSVASKCKYNVITLHGRVIYN